MLMMWVMCVDIVCGVEVFEVFGVLMCGVVGVCA